MPMCPLALLEEMQGIVSDMESALGACDPEEPLALGFCILEVRASILDLERVMRAYEREEVVCDDER